MRIHQAGSLFLATEILWHKDFQQQLFLQAMMSDDPVISLLRKSPHGAVALQKELWKWCLSR